jgi:hypothetical protein
MKLPPRRCKRPGARSTLKGRVDVKKVPQNQQGAARIRETRAAYHEACSALGYREPTREAAEVIDLLGVTEDGQRVAHLAPFYPNELTTTVDRAARLARIYPEALIDEHQLALLDLLLTQVLA